MEEEKSYLSSDIYQISDFLQTITNKHIPDQKDSTLLASTFGYLNEINQISLQNQIIATSEYGEEGIPIKAKFEKNVIAHAMGLGITKINATPATMSVLLFIPEEDLIKDLKNDKFIIDKDIPIIIENKYEFHLDYDIIITRTKLSSGEYVYTALYDMGRINPISKIESPYLLPIGLFLLEGNITVLAINTVISQISYESKTKKILSDNPLESKVINFEFQDQLAYFNVVVTEGEKEYFLTPIYDGLINQDKGEYYCYYTYMDSNSIRVKFARDSYEPRINANVTINIRTTQGFAANFKYNNRIIVDLQSDRIAYHKAMYMLVQPTDSSRLGVDRKSVKDLRRLIPAEALARGSITNEKDLYNFFNSTNNDNCRLYFNKRRDNQLERLYYAYMVLKDGNNVIPTNTIDIYTSRDKYDTIHENGCVLKPGHMIRYTNGSSYGTIINPDESESSTNPNIFEYMNPFLCIVNYKPFYLSYFLTFLNINRGLEFTYINQNSNVQFIASYIEGSREYFTDPNLYKIKITMEQNISKDFGIAATRDDETGEVHCDHLKVYALILDKKGGVPIRYLIGKMTDFENNVKNKRYIYDFEFILRTEDVMNKDDKMLFYNTISPITHEEDPIYLSANINLKIAIFIDVENGNLDRRDLDKYLPGLEDFTLANEYSVCNGLDLFIDYTDIVNSSVQVADDAFGNDVFILKKVPLIRYSYINSEDRLVKFTDQLEEKRQYIQYALLYLEDNFGIDFKFFNTYGPSRIFMITEEGEKINRVNLSMTCKIKTVSANDNVIVNKIIEYIKEYMEDLNEITDLHTSNLVTEITTKYREQLVYFDFIDINGYGPGYKHIYHIEDEEYKKKVPEFLNINTLEDNSPDITIILG